MIRRLHHAQITVPSARLEEARCFYADVLGLEQIERPSGPGWRPDGCWFQLSPDGVALHIGVEDGVERTPTRAHIAYEVDDLDAMLARVRAASCACRTQDQPDGPLPLIPGWRRFQSRDPFGNQIEFISPVRSA